MKARKCLVVWLILAGTSALLCACAGTGRDSDTVLTPDQALLQLTEQNGRDCFYIAHVEGFGTLDDGVVSVSTRMNDEYYLVTTAFRCSWLSSSLSMGFQGPGGQVCGGGSSHLVGGGSTCPVAHVFSFTSRDDAMTAWELVKAKREIQQQYQVPR